MFLELITKKTWTIYFVYVLPGIAKRLIVLNEQMPTPTGVNNLLQFLTISKFGEFGRTRIKSGRSMSLCPNVCGLCHGQYGLKIIISYIFLQRPMELVFLRQMFVYELL